LPLTLRPANLWSLALQNKKSETSLCSLLSQNRKACSICLLTQGKITPPDASVSQSTTCPAGLCETAIPIRIGNRLIGFLQTGQVRLKPACLEDFHRFVSALGTKPAKQTALQESYFAAQQMDPARYRGAIHLLEIFAGHLGLIGNQLILQDAGAESPFIKHAKTYIQDHHDEELKLTTVARELHMSVFHFCKMFKKSTGLTFTDYLGRARIERAKTLLLDPNHRISEVAFAVGFGSLTHFNRTFLKLVGCSPSDYRKNLPHPHMHWDTHDLGAEHPSACTLARDGG
jgi:AraC-like DNA-binding protein/ligand-binding sensor protein